MCLLVGPFVHSFCGRPIRKNQQTVDLTLFKQLVKRYLRPYLERNPYLLELFGVLAQTAKCNTRNTQPTPRLQTQRRAWRVCNLASAFSVGRFGFPTPKHVQTIAPFRQTVGRWVHREEGEKACFPSRSEGEISWGSFWGS